MLIASSPSTSALLGAQRLKLTGKQEESDTSPNDGILCGSCGYILIPGWSCRKIQPNARHKRRNSLVNRQQQRQSTFAPKTHDMFYQCDKCGFETLRPSVRRTTRSADTKASSVPLVTSSVAPDVGTHARSTSSVASKAASKDFESTIPLNTAIKKRPRARKPAGLQAMLANSKKGPVSSGLNLMDFMKSI